VLVFSGSIVPPFYPRPLKDDLSLSFAFSVFYIRSFVYSVAE
jgi:hypothetical protein